MAPATPRPELTGTPKTTNSERHSKKKRTRRERFKEESAKAKKLKRHPAPPTLASLPPCKRAPGRIAELVTPAGPAPSVIQQPSDVSDLAPLTQTPAQSQPDRLLTGDSRTPSDLSHCFDHLKNEAMLAPPSPRTSDLAPKDLFAAAAQPEGFFTDPSSPMSHASPEEQAISHQKRGVSLTNYRKANNRNAPLKVDEFTIHTWLRSEAMFNDSPQKDLHQLIKSARNNFQNAPEESFQNHPMIPPTPPVDSLKPGVKRLGECPPNQHMPTTATTESNSLRRFMLEDFLHSKAGDWILLQVSQSHPQFACWRDICQRSPMSPVHSRHPNSKREHQPHYLQMWCRVLEHKHRDVLVSEHMTRSEFVDMLWSTGKNPPSVKIQFPSHFVEPVAIPWSHLLEHADAFEMWSPRPQTRDFNKSFRKIHSVKTAQKTFNRLAIECHHDAVATVCLCHACQLWRMRRGILDDDPDLGDTSNLPPTLARRLVRPISKHSDKLIKAEFEACFGAFVPFNASMMSDDILDSTIAKLKSEMTDAWTFLFRLLGHDQKLLKKENKHLKKQHKRLTLLEFVSLCRVRDNHHFSWFAATTAMVSCGQSGTASLSRSLTFFGVSLSEDALKTKLKSLNKEHLVMEKAEKAVTSQHIETQEMSGVFKRLFVSFGVFDNTQKNFPCKWQRGTHSSNFVRATSRMFIKLWQGPWMRSRVPTDRSDLTCLKQAMPSPFFMPPHESSLSNIGPFAVCRRMASASPTVDPFPMAGSPPVDFAGKRVQNCVVLLQQTLSLVSQKLCLASDWRRMAHWPPVCNEPNLLVLRAETEKGLAPLAKGAEGCAAVRTFCVSQLRGQFAPKDESAVPSEQADAELRLQALIERFGDEINHPELLSLFERPQMELLALPITKDDETTLFGVGSTLVKLMCLAALLVPQDTTNRHFKAAKDLSDRWLVLVGDGLACERLRNCANHLNMVSGSFLQACYQAQEIRKAQSKVLVMPGDLHALEFHVLSATCKFFFGGLLQASHVRMGWKHVDWKKAEKNYHHAKELALIVFDVLEVHLHDAWLHSMSRADTDHIRQLAAGAQSVALSEHLMESFDGWQKTRLKESTDEEFLRVLMFCKCVRLWKLGKHAIEVGDSVAMEHAHTQNLMLWAAANKNTCTEIALTQMEDLYRRTPHELLQTVRDNRTQKHHVGMDGRGFPTHEMALDRVIEDLQWRHKMMQLGSNVDSFIANGVNVTAVQRSIQFVNGNHCRRWDCAHCDCWEAGFTDQAPIDHNRRKKASTQSNRQPERLALSELFTLGKITVETPRRKARTHTLWDHFPNCMVDVKHMHNKLKDEKNEKRESKKKGATAEPLRDITNTPRRPTKADSYHQGQRTMELIATSAIKPLINRPATEGRPSVDTDDESETGTMEVEAPTVDAEAEEILRHLEATQEESHSQLCESDFNTSDLPTAPNMFEVLHQLEDSTPDNDDEMDEEGESLGGVSDEEDEGMNKTPQVTTDNPHESVNPSPALAAAPDRATAGNDGETAEVEAESTVVVCGNQHKVRKVKINGLAHKDLFLLGEEKLEKMNLVATRHRRNRRQERERKVLHDDLRRFLEKEGTGSGFSWIKSKKRKESVAMKRFQLAENLFLE